MNPIKSILQTTKRLVAPLLAAASIGTTQGQTGIDPIEIHPLDPPCPSLLARDIQQEQPTHTVRLVFPAWPDIDVTSLSDGDLIAQSANGLSIRSEFVSFSRETIPFPNLSPPSLAECGTSPSSLNPHPSSSPSTASKAPATTAGIPPTTAPIESRLAADEILTESGRALPSKSLGGFRCLIREEPGNPVQPTRLDISFRRVLVTTGADPSTEEVQFLADVTMAFDSPHIDVDFGQVTSTGNNFLAEITATEFPIPSPITPVSLFTADEVARSNSDDLDPVSADQLTFLPTFRHTYRLGALAPGTYPFTAQVNGIAEDTKDLVIPIIPPIDSDPPEAELATRNITIPNNNPARFAVTYADAHAINVATLGDDDVAVFSPCLNLPILTNPSPCSWQAQRARLEQVIPLNDDFTKVRAIYAIEPPRGGWRQINNGFYPIALLEGSVCDRLDNCVDLQRLGGFEVAIDDSNPPIPARAEIRVDASNPSQVLAKVHVQFGGNFAVTETRIRRDGQRIFLIADVEELDTPSPTFPEEDLRFDIGALRAGDYVAAFLIEGRVLDREAFSVAPSPPVAADVDLVLDFADPENVSAQVTIQFRTPHRVSQGQVRFQGNRVILPAKAEPSAHPA